MKRTILSFALVLALLTGCSTAATPAVFAAAQPQPVSTPVALAASKENQLTVILTDCSNSILIKETDRAALAFSGAADRYRYTVSGPVDGVTTVNITQLKDVDFNGAALTVPLNVYNTISVQGKDYAANLQPRKADYIVTGEDCAMSSAVSSSYAGSFSMDMKDSSLSISLKASKNYSLTLDAKDCAISTPKEWGYRQGKALSMTRGIGGAALNFQLKNCAVTFEEAATDFTSRYEEYSTNMSMSMNGNLEMVLGNTLGSGSYGYGNRDMERWRTSAKANTVTDISTIPATEITALQVNATLCGLVLEPSKSSSFELCFQGVEDIKAIQVIAETKNGILTVTAEGTEKDGLYINASPDYRVNCVRLLVPEDILRSLTVDCGTGIVATNGLALPSVTGGTLRGMVALTSKSISSPIAMNSSSGCVSVTAETASAPITLSTKNGSGEVKMGTTTADVTLTAKNGSVEADVGTATGKLSLTAANGSVEATVDHVKDAVFEAKNGSVEVTLGTITGSTSCTVTNGDLAVELTRKPTDLAFHLGGGWKDNLWDDWDQGWHKKNERPTGLPSGWYDGLVLGSGKASLTLSASTNGDLSLIVP